MIMVGMELPNQENIRTLVDQETYKYLGILEAGTIKHVKIKEKIKKEYIRRIYQLWMVSLVQSSKD